MDPSRTIWVSCFFLFNLPEQRQLYLTTSSFLVYVPKDGSTHTGTQLGIHFFDCDGVIAAALERGDLVGRRLNGTTPKEAAKLNSPDPTANRKKTLSAKSAHTKQTTCPIQKKTTNSEPVSPDPTANRKKTLGAKSARTKRATSPVQTKKMTNSELSFGKTSEPVQTKKMASSEPVHYPGHSMLPSNIPMDDTKLVGKLKLLTLESVQASINILATFMNDNDHDRFVGTLFQPLWARLKDQGADESNLSWRYETYRNPLSSRNWCFVPPCSELGNKGQVGKDYFISEESVVLCVLEEVSTLKQVSDLVADHEESFSTILPVLTSAVEEGLEYKDAKRGASASVRSRRSKSVYSPNSSPQKLSPKSAGTTKRKSPTQKKETRQQTSSTAASKKRRASKITPTPAKKQKTSPQAANDEHTSPSFHMTQTQAVDVVIPSFSARRSPVSDGPLKGYSFFYSGIDASFGIDDKIKRLGGKVVTHSSFTIESAYRKLFFLADYKSWRKVKYIHAASLGVPMIHYKWLDDFQKKPGASVFDSELYIKHRLPLGLDLGKEYYPLQRASNARAWDAPGKTKGEGERVFNGMTIALAIEKEQEHDWKMILMACGAKVKTLEDIQKGRGKIDVECCLFSATSLPPHVISTPPYVSQLMQVIEDDSIPLLDLAWAHQSIIQRKRLPLLGDDRYSVSIDHKMGSSCSVNSIKSKKTGVRYEIGDLVQFSRGAKTTSSRGRIMGISFERQGKGCKFDVQLLVSFMIFVMFIRFLLFL